MSKFVELLVGACFVSLLLAASPAAAMDDYSLFIHAKNAYDVGDYKEAVNRFEAALGANLANPALVLECHKFAGVSYLFVGNREKAEQHFTELLTIAPEYTLDAMIFPIEVVDFFQETKQKNQERLDAVAHAKIQDERKRKAAEEARLRAEIERLKETIYLERSSEHHSLLVALLPLGAGQFQNGHKIKGALLLSSELFLGATAIITFAVHETLREKGKQPFASDSDLKTFQRREQAYRLTNQLSLAVLGAAAIAGIIDSLYFFTPEHVSWREVDEEQVPGRLRTPKKSSAALAPSLGERSWGLQLSVDF